MVNYQWTLYWADLNPSKGYEQAGKRPVLVISNEVVNQALPVVTILSITSVKEGRTIYPTEVYMPAALTGLSKDSILMAHQIRSISKERLTESCGYITDYDLRESILKKIKLYLDL